MKVAEITKDRLYDPHDVAMMPDHREMHWTQHHIASHAFDASEYAEIMRSDDICQQKKTRFRLKDDDGEVYYEGWLLNDDLCSVQSMVLSWGMYDSGCTMIEVWTHQGWKQEIS